MKNLIAVLIGLLTVAGSFIFIYHHLAPWVHLHYPKTGPEQPDEVKWALISFIMLIIFSTIGAIIYYVDAGIEQTPFLKVVIPTFLANAANCAINWGFLYFICHMPLLGSICTVAYYVTCIAVFSNSDMGSTLGIHSSVVDYMDSVDTYVTKEKQLQSLTKQFI